MAVDPLSAGLNLGSAIIDKIFPDKNERNKYKLALLEMEQRGELIDIEKRYEAIVAEAKSSDRWTSRARPAFMYVFYLYLVWVLVMSVVAVFSPSSAQAMTSTVKLGFEAVPPLMWNTFLMGYLGYGLYRTVDKGGAIQMVKDKISKA